MNSSDTPRLFRPAVGKLGMTELHYAAYCGDIDALRRALDEGAKPNETDEYRGYTALLWLCDMAATGGPRVEMLQLLVEAGADLTIKSNDGETAISLAKESGSSTGKRLVKELRKHGAPSK